MAVEIVHGWYDYQIFSDKVAVARLAMPYV
jgi:hypothetical protein